MASSSLSIKSWIATIFMLSLVATARGDDNGAAAKEHFQKANAHFAVGEFEKAGEEFQAAYMLRQDPALLFNAAQAYRLAGNNDKALILYKNYLQFFPNEPNAEEVRAQVTKLKEAIAADAAKTAPKPAPDANSPKTAAAPEPVQATPTVSSDRHAAPDRKLKPVYKQWWLWTIVGVVAAGAAVGIAVGVTQRHGTWANLPEFGPGSANGLTVRF